MASSPEENPAIWAASAQVAPATRALQAVSALASESARTTFTGAGGSGPARPSPTRDEFSSGLRPAHRALVVAVHRVTVPKPKTSCRAASSASLALCRAAFAGLGGPGPGLRTTRRHTAAEWKPGGRAL